MYKIIKRDFNSPLEFIKYYDLEKDINKESKHNHNWCYGGVVYDEQNKADIVISSNKSKNFDTLFNFLDYICLNLIAEDRLKIIKETVVTKKFSIQDWHGGSATYGYNYCNLNKLFFHLVNLGYLNFI